jgi:hypothetical protein
MFGHVGRERLRVLQGGHGGPFGGQAVLNHSIADRRTADPAAMAGWAGDFVSRYVFPDGELVTVEMPPASPPGRLRADRRPVAPPHYALTLSVGGRDLSRPGARTGWRGLPDLAHLATSGAGSDSSLDVAQLLLARPGVDGPATLPLQPWWRG